MNKNDIKTGLILQSNNDVRKIKIVCVDNEDNVSYEPLVFGKQDIKCIKMDKLLENFKLIDEY